MPAFNGCFPAHDYLPPSARRQVQFWKALLRILSQLVKEVIGAMKRIVKNLCHVVTPKNQHPIIVASMGRSGSTLVHKSVAMGMAKARCKILSASNYGFVASNAFEPSMVSFKNGLVYKTHALGGELPIQLNGARAIYVFGSAKDAALSVLSCRERYGEEWVNMHLKHLRAAGRPGEVTKYDVFRFKEQIKSWLSRADLERLFIKYSDLWESEEFLSDFCGFDVRLPPKRPRNKKVKIDNETLNQVGEVYKNLDAFIDSMPGCFRLGVGESRF